MKPAVTVQQIRTFLAVSDWGSMTRAAAALHLSQGAVTQEIHLLERSLKVRLLERGGRGLRLTEVGTAVAAACRRASEAIEAVEKSAIAFRTLETGSLSIGTGQTAGSYYLPQRLAPFVDANPRIQVTIAVNKIRVVYDHVVDGTLDCAVIEGPLPSGTLLQVPLVEDEFVVVVHVRHPLGRFEEVSPEELSSYRYLAQAPGSITELFAVEMLGSAYPIVPRLELDSLDAIRANVIAGVGFAVLPRVAVRVDIDGGILREVPVPPRRRWIYALRRPVVGGPAMEAFWTSLLEQAPHSDTR